MTAVPFQHRRFLKAMVAALLLGGCAALERGSSPGDSQSPPLDTEPAAPLSAPQWMETDAVVTVDNAALAPHVRSAILDMPSPDGATFEAVRVHTRDGQIGLTLEAQLTEADGTTHAVRAEGTIELSYGGSGLSWFPRIEKLTGPSTATDFDADRWLERLNAAFAHRIVARSQSYLGMRFEPPRAIHLQVGLQGLGVAPQSRRFDLQGAYNVAASMMRVGKSHTAIALDLEFVDGLKHCDSDFSIGRATFAGRIVNREPRDIAAQVPANAAEWHYFTEVTDARRELTLVHYWFADGRAVGITELPVEPSARWRTWSTLPVVPGTVRHIEVLAADRDAGCIVSGAHITVAPGSAYSEARFHSATRNFPVARERPAIAAAELSRTALAEALNDALGGARFALRFDESIVIERALSGRLEVLDTATLQCIRPNCTVQTECRVDFARCQRRQDMRECTTCLFRNPLNNRCMSERVDAECEGRKADLNERYSREWETCMARERASQAACQRRGQEAVEVCEQRAEQFSQTCQANQATLQDHGGPIAEITGNGRASGTVSVDLTDLEVSGDLAALKGLVTVAPNLDVAGALEFEPGDGLGALGACIGEWDAPFSSRFDRSQAPRRLAGPMHFSEGELMAQWPGLTMPIAMTRGPIEAFLLDEPWRLSNCMPGMTTAQVGAQAAGEEGLFLRGLVPVDVAPGTARIELPGFSARLGSEEHEARATSDGLRFRYELEFTEEE